MGIFKILWQKEGGRDGSLHTFVGANINGLSWKVDVDHKRLKLEKKKKRYWAKN
jgi:hypothetical protein